MSKTSLRRPNRRQVLVGGTAAALASLSAPTVLRAQPPELVVGGAASHRDWVENIVIPHFEERYDCKVLFEGTRSLVNLEKMQSNRDGQYLSVIQMDDPVMILAVEEGLLEPLTAADVPNLTHLKEGTLHMDGMWANYLQPWQGIAYNREALPDGIESWASLWDPEFAGRVILPSLQNTEGVANLFMASSLETGASPAEAQYDPEPGFARLSALRPNVLTIYTQMPQAYNLLETGEAWAIAGAYSSFALPRAEEGSPIGLAAPKEGIFAAPSGVCLVRGGPHEELARAYINELLGAELQAKLAGPTYSLPTNTGVAAPEGMDIRVPVHPTDWAHVAQNRSAWVERWDREMAL